MPPKAGMATRTGSERMQTKYNDTYVQVGHDKNPLLCMITLKNNF